MAKFNIKQIGITIILSLALVTILSVLISKYTEIPVFKTGTAFIILFVSVFIIYLFVAVSDFKIDKREIWTMLLIAGLLIGTGYVLKNFVPEIFSALPEQTQNLFSSWGVK